LRQAVGKGSGCYGRFAEIVEGVGEGVGVVRSLSDQLVLSGGGDLAAVLDVVGGGSGGGGGETAVPVDPSTNDAEPTAWLDDLHERIALCDHVGAVEAIDRLRQSPPTASKQRLAAYTDLLKQSLLTSLAQSSMDPPTVFQAVTLLHQLECGSDARDCLLSAWTRRIRKLTLLCCGGAGGGSPSPSNSAVLARAVIGTLRAAVVLFKRAFPEACMASGLVVWVEAHVVELHQFMARFGCDCTVAIREEVEVMKRETGFDLAFLLTPP
jgi:hypothetical protein